MKWNAERIYKPASLGNASVGTHNKTRKHEIARLKTQKEHLGGKIFSPKEIKKQSY